MAFFAFLLALQLFNVLVGSAALGIGVYMLISTNPVLTALGQVPLMDLDPDEAQIVGGPSFLDIVAYSMIGLGLLTLLVVITGCCAALEKSKGILFIYTIFAFIILFAVIGGLFYVVSHQDGIGGLLQGVLNDTIVNYDGIKWSGDEKYNTGKSGKPFSLALDAAMVHFKCCGVNSIDDFETLSENWKNKFNVSSGGIKQVTAKVPVTCCKMKNPSAYPSKLNDIKFVDILGCVNSKRESAINNKPCFEAIRAQIMEYSTPIYLIVFGVTLLELLGATSALCLIRCMANEEAAMHCEKMRAFQMLGMMNPMSMLYTPGRGPPY